MSRKKRTWVLTYLMDGATCVFLGCSSALISWVALISFLRQLIKPHLFFSSSSPSLKILPSLSFLSSAIAPDFSQNLLKAQTLARQGGDVLIECKPRMSPRGMISWRKGKEALRESHRYVVSLCKAVSAVCLGPLFSLSALLEEQYFHQLILFFPLDIHGDKLLRREPQCNTIQFELHNMFCTPPLSPCYVHFFWETSIVLCSPGCAQGWFLLLFTWGNWPFVDCSTWIDVLIHQLINGM